MIGGLDPAVSQEISGLEEEIKGLTAEMEQCAAEAKKLVAAEAAGGPPMAGKIHELKQRRMMLATEIQHRKVRINLLLLAK